MLSLVKLCQFNGGETERFQKACLPAGREEAHMLRWSAVFFVIAIVAAMFGFTNIAGTAMGVAQILFFLFLIPAIVLFIGGLILLS